jgi:hypothetical protein
MHLEDAQVVHVGVLQQRQHRIPLAFALPFSVHAHLLRLGPRKEGSAALLLGVVVLSAEEVGLAAEEALAERLQRARERERGGGARRGRGWVRARMGVGGGRVGAQKRAVKEG